MTRLSSLFTSFMPSLLLAIVFMTYATSPSCRMTDMATSDALGPVYPIAEPNLLVMLKTHAQESHKETQKRKDENTQRLKAWRDAPKGVRLARAQKTEHRVVPHPEALTALLKGHRRLWLFIDARHVEDIALARHFLTHTPDPLGRVVLVAGSVKDTQDALQARVWFDQGAALLEKLALDTLPALVAFDEKALHVTTFPASISPQSFEALLQSRMTKESAR